MKNKATIITTASILIVIISLYITFKFLQRKEARIILDKKVSSQSLLSLQKAFSTTRWQSGTPKISDTTARSICKKIYDSVGWFTEDEDAINKAFYGIKTYDDLSLIAYQYQSLYGKNLYTVIQGAYKNDNVKLARLRSIIAQKVQMK